MTRAVWLWIALMAGAPSAVAAQVVGGATGTIAGTVTDATSAALAGASVTVTGPAIMRPRTVVTDARGHYQIVALPPGDYAIEFRHTGFRTATRTGVVVGVDFTAGVDAELDVGPIETAVAVSARPPVVDPNLTSLSFSFDPQMLASLPGARSMGSLLAAAPGVFLTRFDVGGNASPPGVYGALGINSLNRPTVEGINVSGIAPTGFALDFGSFDTVWVGTGAHTAEWYSPGVHMQFVIKSGGNRYAGTIYADYEPRDWQSVNIDAAQIARGAAGGAALPPAEANRVWSDRDLDADIGGYVRRDRLWWYASVRDQDAAIRAVNFPIVPLRTQITSYGGKLTWSLRPSQRAVLYGQGGRNHQPYRLDAFAIGGVGAATAIHESVESTSEQVARGRVWKAEWNAAIGSRFYVDARIGEFDADRPERPRGQAPRFEDIGTQIVCGGSRDLVQSLNRTQANGSINVLADDGPGRHHVKVGWEISQTMATDDWAAASPGDVLHVLRNARPTEVVLFESPSRSQTGQRSYALFVSDGWQITDRLTLHLGGRLDRHRLFLPAQAHGPARFNPMREVFAPVDAVIDWNLFVPRLSAAFDVTGDGRTIAKLSVNQYHTGPGVELAAAVNPNAAPWWRRYAWSDPNRNGVWDAGEEGTELARRGGLSTERLDPALELPRLTEIAASVERDVGHGLALRAAVVRRVESDLTGRQDDQQPFEAFTVPVPVADPGPDGVPGSSDDGAPITAYQVSADRVGLPPLNVTRNIPDTRNEDWTFELSATRRLSGRWSMTADFSHLWTHDNASGYLGQPVRANAVPVTPNDFIHADDNGRHVFRVWSAKVFGTVAAPWGISVTPMLRHQSGQPFGRTIVAALNYSRSVRILAEPIGTRRMDAVTVLDVRVEKSLPRLLRHSSVFVDVFNALNANPATTISWSSDAFQRPLTIMSPRIVRLGVRIVW